LTNVFFNHYDYDRRKHVSRRDGNAVAIAQCDFNNLQFGKIFADHMFVVNYKDGQWQQPRIVPYGNLSLSPALSSLHYGQALFEGLKATKNEAGDILVFRPEANARRLNASAVRLCMPELPEEIFMNGLAQLLGVDRNWIPTQPGCSLYIRPVMFATDDYIGVKPSDTYSFIIFTSPVGAYYNKPVRVKVETEYTRPPRAGWALPRPPATTPPPCTPPNWPTSRATTSCSGPTAANTSTSKSRAR
jgi:branched-chain amino acid aminotransferase